MAYFFATRTDSKGNIVKADKEVDGGRINRTVPNARTNQVVFIRQKRMRRHQFGRETRPLHLKHGNVRIVPSDHQASCDHPGLTIEEWIGPLVDRRWNVNRAALGMSTRAGALGIGPPFPTQLYQDSPSDKRECNEAEQYNQPKIGEKHCPEPSSAEPKSHKQQKPQRDQHGRASNKTAENAVFHIFFVVLQ
jgi:hypothetical protein